eukprot:jgi/Tetstr1/435416/TSEL_024325.t1
MLALAQSTWLDEPFVAKQSDIDVDLPGKMYLVVCILLIQGEHYANPNFCEVVEDVTDAGDDDPMAVSHTNAEWLAMFETWTFCDLLRRACIKVMNATDTARDRKAIQLLSSDAPAKDSTDRLSDHIIEADDALDVSDEQAAARLDAIAKFRAKVDDLITKLDSPKSSRICSKVLISPVL